MKKYKIRNLSILIILGLFLAGCGAIGFIIEALISSYVGIVAIPVIAIAATDLNGQAAPTKSGMILLPENGTIPEGYLPASGAKVTIESGTGSTTISGTTDSNGRFKLDGIQVGTRKVTAEYPDFTSISQVVTVPDPNGALRTVHNYKILPEGTLKLSLRKNTLQIPQAVYTFYSYGLDPNNIVIKPATTWSVTSGSGIVTTGTSISVNGEFRTLTSGTFTVTGKAQSDPTQTASVIITVVDYAVNISGTVRDGAGTGLSGATVSVGSLYSVTDTSGNYSIIGIPAVTADTLTVSATKQGYTTGTVTVNVTGVNQTITAPVITITSSGTPVVGTPTVAPTAVPTTVFNNGNLAGVNNGPPPNITQFTIPSSYMITSIVNYHWNNGVGNTSTGTISLRSSGGTVYGPWNTTGSVGQGGVPNAYWTCYPNVVIPAGTYQVIDADPNTWSNNSGSGDAGITNVQGYISGSATPVPTTAPTTAPTSATGNWAAQTSGFTNNLTDIYFVDSNNAMVSGNNGLVLTTANGGTNWSGHTAAGSVILWGVHFLDVNNGWAVGSSGTVTHTTNGGSSFSIGTQGTTDLYHVYFTDASNGWIVGTLGKILHTTNGGSTWTAQTSGTSNSIKRVYFFDANNGWAVGEQGTILHTTDGGSTWTAQTSGTTNALWGLSFVDANNGWTVGTNGTILRTTNGGSAWTAQTSGLSATYLSAVSFVDSNNGWAVGDIGTILRTTNGGSTWTGQTSGTTQSLFGVRFANGTTGWAVGNNGTILKYVP